MKSANLWLAGAAAVLTAATGGLTRDAVLNGVHMRYPADWKSEVKGADAFRIVKPLIAYHGPIQPRGQLRIIVTPSAAPDKSMAGSIAAYSKGDELRTKGVVNLPGNRGPCTSMPERIVADDQVPPEFHPPGPRSIVYTDLFCLVNGQVYVGIFSAWDHDPRAVEGRRVLIEVMRSLRPTRPTPP